MKLKKTRRRRRDPELAQIVGENILSRRTVLGLSQTVLAGMIGVSQPNIVRYEKGLQLPRRFEQIASALIATPNDLVSRSPLWGQERPTSAELERSMLDALGEIRGAPLRDIANVEWLEGASATQFELVAELCLAHIRRLQSLNEAKEQMNSLGTLDAFHQIGQLRRSAAARRLSFEALDVRTHFRSFALAGVQLIKETKRDLQEMSLLSDLSSRDPILRTRFLIRKADVLKINSDGAGAWNLTVEAFDIQREFGGVTLSYPAFRNACLLSAEKESPRFREFQLRAEQIVRNGGLWPHDNVAVMEGAAEAYAIRYARTRALSDATRALKGYSDASEYAGRVEAHYGGRHIEHGLRLDIKQLTYAGFGIDDLLRKRGGSSLQAREELALNLLIRARTARSARLEQRLVTTIQELHTT